MYVDNLTCMACMSNKASDLTSEVDIIIMVGLITARTIPPLRLMPSVVSGVGHFVDNPSTSLKRLSRRRTIVV